MHSALILFKSLSPAVKQMLNGAWGLRCGCFPRTAAEPMSMQATLIFGLEQQLGHGRPS